MRLAVPVGTIGTVQDRVRIMITGWSVRNDGTVEGYVGGRLQLQLAWKAMGIPVRENTVIDGGWSPGLAINVLPRARLYSEGLSAVTSSTVARRQLVWDPVPYRVRPGATVQVNFNLLIGIELIAGFTDVDIVASVERLDTVTTLPVHRRWPNAFSVERAAPPAPVAFTPILVGQAAVQVNPF